VHEKRFSGNRLPMLISALDARLLLDVTTA